MEEASLGQPGKKVHWAPAASAAQTTHHTPSPVPQPDTGASHPPQTAWRTFGLSFHAAPSWGGWRGASPEEAKKKKITQIERLRRSIYPKGTRTRNRLRQKYLSLAGGQFPPTHGQWKFGLPSKLREARRIQKV